MLFVVFLIVLVCVLLVVVILAQNSKGGGLTAGMGGASQIMGARRTTDWIEKATWGLAGALLVFSLSMHIITSPPSSNSIDDNSDNIESNEGADPDDNSGE